MPKKILIVDDERNLNDLLAKALGGRGYETHQAYNGKDAFDKIDALMPDMLILDVMLPDFTGHQILEVIRNKETTKGIPVLMLTQKALVKDIEEALGLGANRYLVKPFDMERLFKTVSEILKE